MNAALLLLADARFPTGAHAHSAGMEPAVGVGDVTDLDSLAELVDLRIATTGLVDASFAAAACHHCAVDAARTPWPVLEAEYLARTSSPRTRQVSRALGRQLLRSGQRAWPHGRYDAAIAELGPSIVQPLAMGLVAHAAGCTPEEAALCELHHLVGALTSAGVRLLGIDPFAIAALSARLAPTLEQTAADAARHGAGDPASLPGNVLLLTDVLAEHHTTWEVRLFAS